MGYVASGKPKGRPKQFYRYELPTGVVKVVRAQCADYERKKIALRSGSLSPEVRKEYEETNEAIGSALADIEEGCRDEFLVDIAKNRGWHKSKINWLLSQNAYYNRKWKAVYEIARRLHLI
ncbi:MAG: hypothetical protein J6A63_05455 [Clostridia bacterium]|nr:hypothetical protein [Clostridia bacterium]